MDTKKLDSCGFEVMLVEVGTQGTNKYVATNCFSPRKHNRNTVGTSTSFSLVVLSLPYGRGQQKTTMSQPTDEHAEHESKEPQQSSASVNAHRH